MCTEKEDFKPKESLEARTVADCRWFLQTRLMCYALSKGEDPNAETHGRQTGLRNKRRALIHKTERTKNQESNKKNTHTQTHTQKKKHKAGNKNQRAYHRETLENTGRH